MCVYTIYNIYVYILINLYKYIKNRLKERNYLIVLIQTEKALEKVQPFFVIKVLKKLGLEKAYYLNKDFIQESYSQILH